MKTLTYLACPYSGTAFQREQRFHAVNRVASDLMRKGVHLVSPVSMNHPIAMAGGLPMGWDFWEPFDRALLECCAKVIVLKLDGWELSTGVAAEIAIAKELGIPVEFMDAPGDEL